MSDPDAQEDPMKAFVHNHDNAEEATFFDQSIKAKLKAALTLMWDAELQLRLYEPAKSLPTQYKILNLLKEISNDSRIYVHRTGFDPPPLKEEMRLTADLDEVTTSTNHHTDVVGRKYPAISQALLLAEQILENKKDALSKRESQQFYKAGQELSGVVIEQPQYLSGLSLLKLLADQKVSSAEMPRVIKEVRKVLWQALPSQTRSPAQQLVTPGKMDQQFMESLLNGEHR